MSSGAGANGDEADDRKVVARVDDAAVSAPADVIVLDGVHKRFGSFVAVHDAAFSIARGEFFSMLGPSGCGKTTTLRMIAGFESPTEGRIMLDGEDVSKTPPYRRNVNTVFQQYALFPHMTVHDNVAFGLRSRKVARGEVERRVSTMLDTVRMGDFARRKPAQLSGGQQQRVALARALVNEPSALLLDEPLAALDLKLRQTMQLELKRIQRETGVTFVFVTHDQQEAITMSDRIAVMSDGWVEQIGSPTDIYHRPATAFVAGFIGEANLLTGTLVDATAAGVDGCTVEVAGHRVVVPGAAPEVERKAGSEVVLMVRPEQVHVSATQPGDARSALPGTVTEVIFRGPIVHVAIQTGGSAAMVAHLSEIDALSGLRPGEPAWACWKPDAAYLVPTGHGATGQGDPAAAVGEPPEHEGATSA